MNQLKLILFIVYSGFVSALQAQESFNASGGNGTGSEGTISYSVGQVVYTTQSDPTTSLVQGVQQPYEISVVTNHIQGTAQEITCSVFPNPTTDALILEVKEFNHYKLRYQLTDSDGKILEEKPVVAFQHTIDLSNLSATIYFITIFQNNNLSQTFKIIKK